jgi:hypothetical protein
MNLESTQAENNMYVDEADVQHISSPIAYHADLYEPEVEYDIIEEDATEVGVVVKSTRARSGDTSRCLLHFILMLLSNVACSF